MGVSVLQKSLSRLQRRLYPIITPTQHNDTQRRVATGVAVVFTGFQLVLRTDYGDRDHVFKPVRLHTPAAIDRPMRVVWC